MARAADTALALDRRSFVPLYVQLHQRLARRIRQGHLAPGGSFPSERELVQTFGVSAITARRVMAELVREGLIERRNGVGTFVRAVAPPKRIALLILEFKEAPQPGHRMIASAFGELVGGVAQAAWESGTDLALAYIHHAQQLAAWLERASVERSVDGLLVRAAGDITEEEVALLDATGLPYVLVKRRVPGHRAPCVVADERQAVRLSMHHLLALGHRRIGFVGSTQSTVIYEERLRGYHDALSSKGLAFDPELVAPAPDFSADSGREAARALLCMAPAARPSALMVASDSMAIGAYEAAAESDLTIPSDLSIASVDDISEARALQPPLTTARTSHVEFGLRSTRLLLRVIDAGWRDEPPLAVTDVIEPELIVRASTAAPKLKDGARPSFRELAAAHTSRS
jgi:DNA-binding LacI/PurR family transcriptional regulator